VSFLSLGTGICKKNQLLLSSVQITFFDIQWLDSVTRKSLIMTTLYFHTFNSPLGLLHFAHANDVVYALAFAEFQEQLMEQLQKRFAENLNLQPAPNAAIEELLERYFAGDINALSLIQTHTDGTPFQQEVWQGLRGIPAGQTTSYQQLAQEIGKENGQRAVGTANGRNPIPLIIPCHRVINSNGKLGGYSGALWRKEWLLKHEGVVCER
jgi:methylated-DNA-[protein]-cysteine S-methyltransferase